MVPTSINMNHLWFCNICSSLKQRSVRSHQQTFFFGRGMNLPPPFACVAVAVHMSGMKSFAQRFSILNKGNFGVKFNAAFTDLSKTIHMKIDILWFKLISKSTTKLICCIYRFPSLKLYKTFIALDYLISE